MDLSMNLWHSNNVKVILCKLAKDNYFWILWALNYIDCIPFSCIHMAHNQAKKIEKVLFLNFWKISNLHLSERRTIKSVLFVCPSVCLSVRLWQIFLRIYVVDFLNFLHEDIIIYIKRGKARFWKIVSVL